MKIIALIFLLSLVLPVKAQQEEVYRLEVNPGQLLTLEIGTGAGVNITTWDENVVEARVVIHNCKGGNCRVTFDPTSSGVKLRSEFIDNTQSGNQQTNISIRIQVPANFNVEFTSAGGSLSAFRLKGDIKGRLGGGAINLTDITGNANLSTGGGSIQVNGGKLQGSLRTGGGNIQINGGLLQGSIATGGGRIQVSGSSISGSASTGGGNIRLNDVLIVSSGDGKENGFSASTGAGSIEVLLSRNTTAQAMNLRLSAGVGKISLKVPQEIDPVINVEMGYTKNSSPGRIISNLDLQIEESQEWESNNGSTPRKYFYGRYSGRNTQQKILIKNMNGNVEVSRY